MSWWRDTTREESLGKGDEYKTITTNYSLSCIAQQQGHIYLVTLKLTPLVN